jgi:hypothetical protein
VTAPLDLGAIEELSALLEAATPAPWEVWSSNSHLRLTNPGGPDGGVCSAMVASDGVPVLAVRRSNIELMAALRNAAPQLLAAARDCLELHQQLAVIYASKRCGSDVMTPLGIELWARELGWTPGAK